MCLELSCGQSLPFTKGDVHFWAEIILLLFILGLCFYLFNVIGKYCKSVTVLDKRKVHWNVYGQIGASDSWNLSTKFPRISAQDGVKTGYSCPC